MKIGVMVCSFYLLPDLSLPNKQSMPRLEDAIKTTSEAGLSGIELQDHGSGIFGFDFPKVPPKRTLLSLREVADSYGVQIPTISVMAGNLLDQNSDLQIGYVRKWLGLASEAGIDVMKINVGFKPPTLGNDLAFERARTCLKRLVRFAEDYGIPLAPELWPPSYPTSDPVAMLTLLKNIDSPFLRHTLDNYMLPSGWAVTAYKLLAPYAVNVHASTPRGSDLRGIGKERFRFKDFIHILKANHYNGYLMIEWRNTNRPLSTLFKGLVKTRMMLKKLVSSA